MRIGIDLGGSHIAIALIDKGVIVKKAEHNFLEEEKEKIEETIKKFLYQEIEDILKQNNEDKIEKIGISVPRKTERWIYRTFAKYKSKKLKLRKYHKEKAK